MGIKFKLTANFTQQDINKITKDYMITMYEVSKATFMQIGLQFVRDARSKIPTKEYHLIAGDARMAARLVGGSINLSSADGFNDDTGNLRSSIGFILLYDGEVVYQDFQLSNGGTDKQTGLDVGKVYAEKISKDFSQGWAIITVAGMEYASWVEALGYDVITGSTMGAEKKLEGAISKIRAKMANYES